jgi:methylthioribose-1-phosphate isomerase
VNVDGVPYRSLWLNEDGWSISIIDQTRLPHVFEIANLRSLEDAAHAIRAMLVRGAPLIGATGAYGLCLALRHDSGDEALAGACDALLATRPTAVNLRWALDRVRTATIRAPRGDRVAAAYAEAGAIAEEDVAINAAIGRNGLAILGEIATRKRGGPVNVLTHCNAGWLATVDIGTATASLYLAHDSGVPVHVWVDETRPRNQGASLTAWELGHHGVPHTVVVDNAGGHLMRQGAVDVVIVGTDRTAANGDVANKIGTYLKALAARDTGVPFFVALPSPTIDFSLESGDAIPIEERAADEVSHLCGLTEDGRIERIRLTPEISGVANPAFDVTPARLVTGLITERGVCSASRDGIASLFPERMAAA